MASLLLNTLIVTGHVSCVYRNFYQKTKTVKRLIVAHCVTDTLLLSSFAIFVGLQVRQETAGINGRLVMFQVPSQVCSAIASWKSISRTNSFKVFYHTVLSTEELLKEDKPYKKSMKKIVWSCVLSFSFITIARTTIALKHIIHQVSTTANQAIYVLLKCYQIVTSIRYYNEFFTYFAFMMIVYIPFERLNVFIIEADKKLNYSKRESKYGYVITKEEREKWVMIFKQVNICTKMLNECYNTQNVCSLGVAISRYIYLIYHILNNIITGSTYEVRDVSTTAAALLYVFLVSIGLVMIGQRIKNESIRLNQSLARFYNKLSTGSDPDSLRFVKDFLRLTTANPVEMNIIINTHAGMYLVPACFSIVINYVVVALQLNHVV